MLKGQMEEDCNHIILARLWMCGGEGVHLCRLSVH